MSSIVIREASVDDAESIAQIHCSSWRDAYADVLDPAFLAGPIEQDRRAVWTSRVTCPEPGQAVFVADSPKAGLAAFICLYLDHDSQWGSLIDNLHVLPGLRGHRIGERLLRTASQYISTKGSTPQQYLWVLEANLAGLRFYERLHGQVVERGASEFPALNKASALRVFWPDASILEQQAL